ncbi:hypothetical protein BDBG_18003 [Blastomyces gilchristii SLH14081]|uniref:Uncharacterized protein n=1 Tax=Blastomyces gilchristii (strain SLH14081) TaxID=559298 RepID=A0A179V208_BLAGS|nr:uncharacterized protein BDBG_18003 [Blastomyces gilchristii SLH14081]OAT14365.1 hypothetical protein BDBG_18003 [Blastomyces gilchristii SLH14081]
MCGHRFLEVWKQLQRWLWPDECQDISCKTRKLQPGVIKSVQVLEQVDLIEGRERRQHCFFASFFFRQLECRPFGVAYPSALISKPASNRTE